MVKNYINHVVFCVDASSSMGHLTNSVVRVFDEQIKHLAQLSEHMDQETRVTVYTFADNCKNIIFDKDVLRLPSLKDLYRADGMTALVDASIMGIEDLKLTCQKYGDHSFLVFVMTDGGENASSRKVEDLKATIKSLPDNWTVATLVPNINGVDLAVRYGFPHNNVQIWDATQVGLENAGSILKTATTNYMQNRAKGIRSSQNLFQLDVKQLTSKNIKKNLQQLSAKDYTLYPVRKDSPIKQLVESYQGSYIIGSGYYQLTKKETIQANKQICVQQIKDGKVFSGQEARDLLGLPNEEVKVGPAFHKDYIIFVQSTSVNRKLIAGTQVLVML